MPSNATAADSPDLHCPTDRELAALQDSALEAATAERLRRHVLVCPACYEIFVDGIRFEVNPVPDAVARPRAVPQERSDLVAAPDPLEPVGRGAEPSEVERSAPAEAPAAEATPAALPVPVAIEATAPPAESGENERQAAAEVPAPIDDLPQADLPASIEPSVAAERSAPAEAPDSDEPSPTREPSALGEQPTPIEEPEPSPVMEVFDEQPRVEAAPPEEEPAPVPALAGKAAAPAPARQALTYPPVRQEVTRPSRYRWVLPLAALLLAALLALLFWPRDASSGAADGREPVSSRTGP